MTLPGSEFERRAQEIASSLNEYLQAASSLRAQVGSSNGAPEGWSTSTPGASSEKVGRTPWVNMSEVHVVSAGRTTVVSFFWTAPDRSSRSGTFVVPMATPDWDATTGSDRLITVLDLMLDTLDWQRNAHAIGNDLYVVLPPGAS